MCDEQQRNKHFEKSQKIEVMWLNRKWNVILYTLVHFGFPNGFDAILDRWQERDIVWQKFFWRVSKIRLFGPKTINKTKQNKKLSKFHRKWESRPEQKTAKEKNNQIEDQNWWAHSMQSVGKNQNWTNKQQMKWNDVKQIQFSSLDPLHFESNELADPPFACIDYASDSDDIAPCQHAKQNMEIFWLMCGHIIDTWYK